MAGFKGRGPERIQRFLPALLVLASLLCLIISTRSLLGLPERVALSAFGFFQKGFSVVGSFMSDTATSISELKRLRQDYNALLEKTKSMEKLERDFSDIRSENERLKVQLGFSTDIKYAKALARIIAKDPGNIYSTITINKGVGEGVRKNMPVIAWQDGVEGLVGRVVEAGQGVSLVVPLYDATSFVAARLTKSRYQGLLVGKGSEEAPLIMKYVPKRARDDTQAGDLVVSSGLESIYPPDIALGRVMRIHELAYQTSLDIDIEPVLDFSRLEYVFVVMPKVATPQSTQSIQSAEGKKR